MKNQITVKCSHHDGSYLWEFQENIPLPIRKVARQQMQTLSPDPGNLLCYWPLEYAVDSPNNWVLRRGPNYVEDDELVVAKFLQIVLWS